MMGAVTLVSNHASETVVIVTPRASAMRLTSSMMSASIAAAASYLPWAKESSRSLRLVSPGLRLSAACEELYG